LGYFYFDESIHERAGFILGAYVYSPDDLSPSVYAQIKAVGLRPGIDEFKSSTKMDKDPQRQLLRDKIKELLWSAWAKVGLVVIPLQERSHLGEEALRGLEKIIRVNDLRGGKAHQVFFDEGISFKDGSLFVKELKLNDCCEFHFKQNSRLLGGLQIADMVAHTMSVMLLETLGIVNKEVRIGRDEGYRNDFDVNLSFVLWASIRHHLFTMDRIAVVDDQIPGFMVDTGSYAVYIAESCSSSLRDAVEKRFGECYLGCIH